MLIFIAGTTLVAGIVPDLVSALENNEIDSCTTISEPGTYELTDDIEDSDADRCILIETGDVTLEGNGHLVDGIDQDETFGVYVEGTGREVTVQDLTVRDWDEGVRIVDGDAHVVGVEATSNHDGVGSHRQTDVQFEDIDAHDNADDGVEVTNSPDTFIIDSHIADNGADGIYLENADDGEVRNNVIEGNDDNGIRGFSPDDTSIRDNEIRDNGEDGILVYAEGTGGEGMSITSNEITDNGDEGIQLTNLRRIGRITDNTVCNNDDKQFLIEDVPNIEMSGNDITC